MWGCGIMSIFNRDKNEPKYDLHPIDDPHKHDRMHLEEILVGISPIIITVMVFILVLLLCMKFGFAFSSEANHTEHLEQIVTAGSVIL